MKNLLLLLTFIMSSLFAFTQTKYTIELNTSDNLKEVIEDFTIGFETYDRYILDSVTITFSSNTNISDEYFYNISNENRNVIEVKREKIEMKYSVKTDPGGVDCEDASLVCSNDSFDGTATNYGTQELNSSNNGCLNGNEHQSSWYYINIETGGSLTMLIDPDNNNDDYDFAVWGPFTDATAASNCPPTSLPIRCSWSDNNDLTGMAPYWGCTLWFFVCLNYGWITPTDNTEGAGGNSYVAPLNTNTGDVYILLIDNFSSSGDPYSVTWGGTAILGCTPITLPIELLDFSGINKDRSNNLSWTTATEINNDYFILENSIDGINWNKISKIKGAGNSTNQNTYSFNHTNYTDTINYYKLSQVDFDGNSETFDIISINNTVKSKYILKIVNMMGQEVSSDYEGLRIILYTDGTTTKRMGK